MKLCFTFLLFDVSTPSMYDESDRMLDGGGTAFLWVAPSGGVCGAVGSGEISNVLL